MRLFPINEITSEFLSQLLYYSLATKSSHLSARAHAHIYAHRHDKYDPKDALLHTIEVCPLCHGDAHKDRDHKYYETEPPRDPNRQAHIFKSGWGRKPRSVKEEKYKNMELTDLRWHKGKMSSKK